MSDDKYITFKRAEFLDRMSGLPIRPLFDPIEIKDAVVIRRQDKFAPAALGSYALGIALVINLTDDEKLREQLLAIADYFQRQAELATDEAWKVPDV